METTKAYGEGGTAPRILSLVIRRYEWSPSRSGRFTNYDNESVGLRASLGNLEDAKISFSI